MGKNPSPATRTLGVVLSMDRWMDVVVKGGRILGQHLAVFLGGRKEVVFGF